MQVSFIVTSYNIEAYIHQCLESLCACARPGDQVIVVDDGSSDQSLARIKKAFADLPWAPDIELTPVFLGSNTQGGVGIAANIGLSLASREAIFFVDGDDWLEAPGVNAARDAFAAGTQDILIANYKVYDEAACRSELPSDERHWSHPAGTDASVPLEEARELALRLNGVPWRKFYRRAFLEQHGLRFPEGDFFYEDNPFHWAVCLRAQTIGFLDVCLAHHRMNRPGQTMSDAGHGFVAMFTHYETILADVEAIAPQRQAAADLWLVANMSWQLERISLGAIPVYAQAAAAALCGARAARWQALCDGELATRQLGHLITALLQGGAQGLIQAWIPWQSLRNINGQLAGIERRLRTIETQAHVTQDQVAELRSDVMATRNVAEYTLLQQAKAAPVDPEPTGAGQH